MKSFRHTMFASFVFWGIGFILGLTTKFSAIITTVLASGLTVTVILVATWAVLGTGKYYVRFPVAFLFGLIPFSAILVGSISAAADGSTCGGRVGVLFVLFTLRIHTGSVLGVPRLVWLEACE